MASIHYWKTTCIAIPDNMKIVHDSEFDTELLKRYMDESYFLLQHLMLEVKQESLPEGYSLQEASVPEQGLLVPKGKRLVHVSRIRL